MYTALDVAKFIINHGIKTQGPVSNLRLQYLLYFVWIDYYKSTNGSILFNDEFSAWSFGPVIPDVYKEFCAWAGTPITTKQESFCIFDNDASIIVKTLKNYSCYSNGEMVQMTHEEDKPWSSICRDGSGNKRNIPACMIVRLECS